MSSGGNNSVIIICTVDVHGNEESYEKDKKMCNYDGSYAGCITMQHHLFLKAVLYTQMEKEHFLLQKIVF